MTFTLPYPPSANAYWRVFKNRIIVSKEARQYKKDAALFARRAGAHLLTGPVAIKLVAYRPRRAGDLDNLLKVTLDALKGVCYVDDGQIVDIRAIRREDPARPRVEVSVIEWHPTELPAVARG